MLAEKFDTFLFDLDGVIYLEGKVLPGVIEPMGKLRKDQKQIRFLTNDPRPERSEMVEKLKGLGIEAHQEEVVTSGWASGRYLRDKQVNKVFVVGSQGLQTELENAGLSCVTEQQSDAVVVGSDIDVKFRDIYLACMQIHGGACFIATNVDPTFPTSKGPAPATGSVVAAIETAVSRPPIVIGKPEAFMFDAALDGVDRSRAVMIGDTPESDIQGAANTGITSVLMKSDQHNGHPASLKSGHQANYTITSLHDLFMTS